MKNDNNDYERIRSDHRSEITDDYLEAIAEIESSKGKCRGGDLANHFSVSHATVTQTLARLKESGLVAAEPYGPVGLTAKGRRLAKKSKERHETVLAFLLAIGVDAKTAAADAEGLEHHVSEKTLECLQSFLDNTAKK